MGVSTAADRPIGPDESNRSGILGSGREVAVAGRFSRTRTVLGLTAVLACGGIALSVGGALSLATQKRDAADQQLDRRVRQAQEAVTAESRRYVDALRTIAAATGAFDEITADKFTGVAAPLASMRLAGATSVAFMVPASESEVPAVQAFWRARGAAGLALNPRGTATEHVFSVFSTPLDGSAVPGTGIDVSQASAPTAALNEARRSGRPTVSDAYQLLRDAHLPAEERQMSFVLTAPVYGLASGPYGRVFRGWVLMGLRGQDFASATLQRVSQQVMDINLRALNSDQEQVSVATLTAPVNGVRDLSRDLDLQVADRRWRLHFTASRAGVPDMDDHLPAAVGAGGTAVSLTMAALVAVPATARRRAHTRDNADLLDTVAVGHDISPHETAQDQLATHAGAMRRELAWRESGEAELRETRDELARQQEFLTQVLDVLEPTILACDIDGVIVHDNHASRAPGSPGEQVTTVSDRAATRRFRHPDGTPVATAELPLLRSLAGEHVDRMEVITDGPDGSPQVMLIHSRPLRQGDGPITGAVASVYDITELRERENELRAFAGVVAHDLKSPLSAIAGYAEILAAGLAAGLPTSSLESSLSTLRASAERMRELIEDLLAYATARDAALDRQAVDLARVVADVLTEQTAHLRNPHTATPVVFPDIYTGPLPVVHADPGMIRRLVDNLIGNALKYTAPGQPARIDISAGRNPGDEYWDITIADRGIGIPAEDRAHVFTSFHRATAHGHYQGTGLGLAICERIVTRHGGTIAATDNPGGGTRIRFTLPAVPTDPGVRAPEPVEAGRRPSPGPPGLLGQ
jgi:signal transduction histidine kinase